MGMSFGYGTFNLRLPYVHNQLWTCCFTPQGYGEPPKELGKSQGHIAPGNGFADGTHGVVLTFEITYGSAQRRKDGLGTEPLIHVPGVALELERRAAFVLTGYLELAETRKFLRKEARGPLRAWAMAAQQFTQISPSDKQCLDRLRENGAVKAKGFRSLLEDHGILSQSIIPGMDMVVVELSSSLSHLPMKKPHFMSEAESKNVEAYFRKQDPSAKVAVVVEGLASHTSDLRSASQNNSSKVRATIPGV